MEGLIARTKKTLNSQFYVMNDSWLKDCIEYYVTEHSNSTDREVLEFVKAQWQLSDLREINNENGCLPRNLSQQKQTTLCNTYILQMEKMYDISTSKYKQLEQIRNIPTANIEATETEKPEPWEPKKKRMLQLHLTDGIQTISAIEYNTISSLNDSLLPGYKVMIIGPVKCRRGVIFLEEGKFKEVGGEVESLLIPNALENVLARALNLQENPDPYNDNSQPANDNTRNVNSCMNNVQQRNEQNRRNEQRNQNNLFDDEFEIDLDEVSYIESQNQRSDDRTQVRNTETENAANRNKRQNTKDSLNEILDLNDDFLEMVDENQLFAPSTSISRPNETRNTSANKPAAKPALAPLRTFPKETDFGDDIEIIEEPDVASEIPRSFKNVEKIPEKNSTEFPEDDFVFDDFDVVSVEKTTKASSKSKNSLFQSSNNAITFTKDAPVSVKAEASSSNKTKERQPAFPTMQLTKDNQPSTSGTSERVIKDSIISGMAQKKNSESLPVGSKRPAASVSPPVTSSSKIRCIQESEKRNKGNRKISDFLKSCSEAETSKTPEPPPPKMCDFICDIVKETVTDVTYKTVRGRITNISKLSKKDFRWMLEGTITDGTGSIDVTFASEVIEKFLGFTVEEFSQKKKLRKTNPEVEQELRTACRNAEQRFRNIDDLLQLELAQDKKARIVKITSLTPNQKEVFDKRLKLMMI